MRRAVLLLAPAIVVATELTLNVSVDGDTFLPYQPIYATLTVANSGSRSVAVPDLARWYVGDCFDVFVVAEGGESLMGPRMFLQHQFGANSPDVLQLAPGDSTWSYFEFSDWTGFMSKEAGDWFHLTPGKYKVVARWRLGMYLEGGPWTGDAERPATFVVRSPTDSEVAAMNLYRNVLYFENARYWLDSGYRSLTSPWERREDEWKRVSRHAAALVTQFPSMLPYCPAAMGRLMRVYAARLIYIHDPPEAIAVWRDSVVSLYKELIERYPDTPTAKFYLGESDYLDRLMGRGTHRAYVASLAGRFPNTRVGAEVSRLLRDPEMEK